MVSELSERSTSISATNWVHDLELRPKNSAVYPKVSGRLLKILTFEPTLTGPMTVDAGVGPS